MKVGDSATVSRAFSREDIATYEALGGAGTPEGEVPEPLIGGLFSYVLGTRLPGSGTNYLKQESMFLAPARVGETLTARLEITRIRADKPLVDLVTTCRGEDGRLICRGRALVYVKDVSASAA